MDSKQDLIVPQIGDLLAYKNMYGKYIVGLCIDIGDRRNDLYPFWVEWLNMSPESEIDRLISYDYDEYCRKIRTYRNMREDLCL